MNQQPGNPYWPFDPIKKREAMVGPQPPVGAALTGQRRMADAPPLSDPNWENWYNQLPPDQKLKYRPIYLQWLAQQ